MSPYSELRSPLREGAAQPPPPATHSVLPTYYLPLIPSPAPSKAGRQATAGGGGGSGGGGGGDRARIHPAAACRAKTTTIPHSGGGGPRNQNGGGVLEFCSTSRFCFPLYDCHCSTCVAQAIRGMMI